MIFSLCLNHRSLLSALLVSALTAFAGVAHAEPDQSTSGAVAAAEAGAVSGTPVSGPVVAEQITATPEQADDGRRIDIGAATGNLFAMQRKSSGTRPRPIDGEQASRSYQRYLKSFETAIPEQFDTGLGLKKQQ